MNTNYTKTKNQYTGDVIWQINDNNLALNGELKVIINDFIKENQYDEYSLTIIDSLTDKMLKVSADINDYLNIISYIYMIEHATPIKFIAINSLTKSYVVEMSFTKGRLQFGNYKYVNGELEQVD